MKQEVTTRQAIDYNNQCDVYLDNTFRECGLGQWHWIHKHNFWSPKYSIEFIDPKDQFLYELRGGEQWRKRIEREWEDTL